MLVLISGQHCAHCAEQRCDCSCGRAGRTDGRRTGHWS